MMNFICVTAITERVARYRAIVETGYAPDTLGPIIRVVDEDDNNRQKAHIFETANDVTRHLYYSEARLSDHFDLIMLKLEDGPVMWFGPEVTVGG